MSFAYSELGGANKDLKAAYEKHVNEFAEKCRSTNTLAALDATLAFGIVRGREGTKIKVLVTRMDEVDHATPFTWAGSPPETVVSLLPSTIKVHKQGPQLQPGAAPPLPAPAVQGVGAAPRSREETHDLLQQIHDTRMEEQERNYDPLHLGLLKETRGEMTNKLYLPRLFFQIPVLMLINPMLMMMMLPCHRWRVTPPLRHMRR